MADLDGAAADLVPPLLAAAVAAALHLHAVLLGRVSAAEAGVIVAPAAAAAPAARCLCVRRFEADCCF